MFSLMKLNWDHKLEEDGNFTPHPTVLLSQAPWLFPDLTQGQVVGIVCSPTSALVQMPSWDLCFCLYLSSLHACEAHAAYQNQNALSRAGSRHKSPLSSFFLPADPGYSLKKGRHKGGRGRTNCPLLSQQLLGEPIKGSNFVHTFPSFKPSPF